MATETFPLDHHAPGCSRHSFAASSCDCGFVAAFLAGQVRRWGPSRGKGGGRRYLVRVGLLGAAGGRRELGG